MKRSRGNSLLLVLVLLGAAAGTLRAEPTPLDEALERLERAASESDPVEAKRLAELSLPALSAQAKSKGVRCPDLFLLGEAQIRAGRPEEALATSERAAKLECDEAERLQLSAWALEFAPDGTRRGEGALLQAAEESWMRAARLLADRETKDVPRIVGALGNAAELALLRGDDREAYERSVAALRLAGSGEQAEALGLTLLSAGAALHGEGACLDLLDAHLDEEAMIRVTEARLSALRARLGRGHDDPVALASVAFYALLAGSEYELYNALRYLQEAIAIRDDLPDAWYLLGRTHEAREQVPQAREAYLRQVEVRPGAAATRLAVNALACLEAQLPSTPAAGREVLALLDAELAKTPREAAFHDSRARLLAALGRRDEACREAALALQLPADDELRAMLLRFQAEQGCAVGG